MSEFWTGPESILRGYLARQELNQRQQQLDQQRENAQGLLEMHQKQLDQSAKQFGEQMKLRQMLIKNMMQEHFNELYGSPLDAPSESITGISPQTQMSQEPNITMGSPAQYDTEGQVTKPGEISSITPDIQHNLQFEAKPWQMDIPGMEGSDIGKITIDPTYQERLARIGLTQAKATASAEALKRAATLPYDLAKEQAVAENKNILENIRREGRLEGIKETWALRAPIEAAHDTSREMVARINALAKELTAQGKQVNADDLQSMYEGITTGKMDYNNQPGAFKPGMATLLKQNGERPFTVKEREHLAGMSVLDQTFENLRDIANNYLASEKDVPGRVTSYLKSFFPTELTNKINQIEQQAPNLVRNLAGVENGRITNLELTKMLHGMVSGKLSREMVLDNLDQLQRLASRRIVDYQLGGMPISQKSRILNSFPDYYNRYKVPIMRNSDGKVGEVYLEDYNKDIESGDYSPAPRK